jgi:hypothetical protein
MSTDRVFVPGIDPLSRALNQLSTSSSETTKSIEDRLTALENTHHLPEMYANFSETEQTSNSSAWVLIDERQYRGFDPDQEYLFVVFGYDGRMGSAAANGDIRVHQDGADVVIYDDEISRTSGGIIHTHPIIWQPGSAAFTLHFEFHGVSAGNIATLSSWFWWTQHCVKEPD